MKKYGVISILASVIIVVLLTACDKQKGKYEVTMTSENATMILTSDQNPLHKGNVKFNLEIKDKAGQPVKAEMTEVRFFINKTPGSIGSHDIRVPAVFKDNSYIVEVSLPSEGEWNVEIEVRMQPGAKPDFMVASSKIMVK